MRNRWDRSGVVRAGKFGSDTAETDCTGDLNGMVVGRTKFASQYRVIAIDDVKSADNRDANSMFRLLMRNSLEFEAVWPLCDYQDFPDS